MAQNAAVMTPTEALPAELLYSLLMALGPKTPGEGRATAGQGWEDRSERPA
jgi:hypothetical protein